MTEAEQRFARAYYAWKMRWAPDVEPNPADFGLKPVRGEQIALYVHQQFEMERVKRVTDAAKCKCK